MRSSAWSRSWRTISRMRKQMSNGDTLPASSDGIVSVDRLVTPARASRLPIHPCNALTIDVEDYFQVEAFAGIIERRDWENHPQRVAQNTHRLLDILSDAGIAGTFFTLGWVAQRHPDLVR